ncbi:FeoB-associated Cys-rich membrane protein [Methylacidiphilum caldifontis]|nr:FeoB-associated Cys-rich membrane protein [Methylacidiphilum caldifontis]
MNWQSIVTVIIVFLALAYLIKVYKKKGAGGCGCDKCIREKKADPFS